MRLDVDALIENNLCIVQSVARTHFASRLPDDDLIQCGLIGLWEATQKWGGNNDFPAFARVCVYHNMLDYVRGLYAKKRLPCEELSEADSAGEDEYLVLETEDLLQEISGALPEQSEEYRVLSDLAINGDIQAVALAMGQNVSEVRKTAKRAYRAVKRAREGK